jgi:cytoskeletal protein CcmA (bactofilin family)
MGKRNNTSVNGIGDISGGEYNDIHIAGVANIRGDINSNKISVDGKAKSHGKINSNYLSINGHFICNNDVQVRVSCDVNGFYKVLGNINGNRIVVNGRTTITENINFDNVEVNGELIVNGNCQCENVKLYGKMMVDGLLSGDSIELNITRFNKIKEIGGEKLVVRRGIDTGFKVFSILNGVKSKLVCEEIEADEIYLENTDCNIVRGRNIEIGRGCTINRIEYSEDLKITCNKSIINEKINV